MYLSCVSEVAGSATMDMKTASVRVSRSGPPLYRTLPTPLSGAGDRETVSNPLTAETAPRFAAASNLSRVGIVPAYHITWTQHASANIAT